MAKEEEHNLFKGAVTENYVAQQLKAKGYDLFYWKDNAYELDFILQKDELIIPLEVKAAHHKRSRSLMAYINKYAPLMSIRTSRNNFGVVNGIKSVPLYAVYLI